MTVPERNWRVKKPTAFDATSVSIYAIDKLIEQARQLAADYKQSTGKPLPGVSNEIAEYDASRLLGLTLCDDRSDGYDALRQSREGPQRVQIKGRTIFNDNFRGQRIGQLKPDKSWDSVVLVLMDENYQPFDVYEALREDVLQQLDASSQSRKKRGAMSVARFCNIGQLVWSREGGLLQDVWRGYAPDA